MENDQIGDDDLSWLRDDSRSTPRVLDHLAQENATAEKVLANIQHLQDSFHNDIAARVPPVERQPAVRRGSHWYWQTRQEGDQYWRLLRCSCSAASFNLPGEQAAQECILDPNASAAGMDYWDLGGWDVSPCGTRLAYTCDTQGSEGYQVVVQDLRSGAELATAVAAAGAYGAEVFWGADAQTLFCVAKAEGSMAAQSLVRLQLQEHGKNEVQVEVSMLFARACEEDSFEVHRSRDGTLLALHSKDHAGSTIAAASLASLTAPSSSGGLGPASITNPSTSSRCTEAATCSGDPPRAVKPAGTPLASQTAASATRGEDKECSGQEPAGSLAAPWKVAAKLNEEDGDLLWVDHWQGCWLGTVDTDEAPNGCICQLTDDSVQVLTEFEAGCEVEEVQLSGGHMVVLLRQLCQFKLVVMQLSRSDCEATCKVTATRLWEKQLPVEAGSVHLLAGPGCEAPVVWVQQSGLVLPVTVVQYDLATQQEKLVQVEEVAGGFDVSNYATQLVWVERPEGVQVPVHVAFHKHRFQQDGRSPLLLHAYGAYGKKLDPSFNPAELPLLDRGWAVAIAHVRGGGELGWRWHAAGRRFQKHNTFEDLVACVDHLVACRYCCPGSTVGWGRSAGGLTMGAALNLRPGLFQAVVLDVPFLDPLTTMLDPSLPLTIKERGEWGDPLEDEDVKEYMHGYSPFENIKRAAYPHLLLTAGLHDHRVNYWEPAKYVARMRQRRTDTSSMLLLLTSGKQGHFASSGAGDRLQERALKYAFFAEALGLGATNGYSAAGAGAAAAATTATEERGRKRRR